MEIKPAPYSNPLLRNSFRPTNPSIVDQFCPDSPELVARVERLQELELKLARTFDGAGRPLDEGIKPAVVALQANGLMTYASCEGHLERGRGIPWVMFYGIEPAPLFPEIPEAKRFRQDYQGAREVYEEVAARHDVPLPDLLKYDNWRIYEPILVEARQRVETGELTPEKIRLEEQNESMRGALVELLADYHQTWQVPQSRRIRFVEHRIEIQSGLESDETPCQGLDDPGRQGHAERLAEARTDMNDFAAYLLQRFMTDGPYLPPEGICRAVPGRTSGSPRSAP